MKMTGIFFGIVLLAVAALIVIDALGTSLGFLDIGGLPIIRIVIGVALLYFAVKAVIDRRVYGCVLPLAIIFLLFEKELASLAGKEDLIPTWTVIVVALLLTIGLAFIFPHRGKRKADGKHYYVSSGKDNMMSEHTEYIDCTDFVNASYTNKLGQLNLCFANTENYVGGGVLDIDNSLGETDIRVPAGWRLNIQIDSALGDVEIPVSVNEGPLLTITGSNRLGEVNIRRV